MFKLTRNVHLGLGLAFALVGLMFALSSLVFIYRPFLPSSRQDPERVVRIDPAAAATPRSLALALMQDHGLAGDLRQIEETPDRIRARIVRPGVQAQVTYDRASGQARIEMRRFNVLETLVQLHVNHGFWHDFWPSNAWAFLSVTASVALLLLGMTGLYLWFRSRQDRVLGSVVVVTGLVYAVTVLVLSRS